MKREDLEKIRGLKKELEDLQRRLEQAPATLQVIFYKDYRTGKGIPKSLAGYDDGEQERRAILRSLRKAQRDGLRLLQEAEAQIEEIEDPETRLIFRRHFIDGASQGEIADELGYSQAAVSKRINRTLAREEEQRSK